MRCSAEKGTTDKPDDLSLVPRTHTMEGESWPLHVVIWLPQECHGTYARTHTYHVKLQKLLSSLHTQEV